MTGVGGYLLGAGLMLCSLALLLSLRRPRRARVVPPVPAVVVFRPGRWPPLDVQVVRPPAVEATALVARVADDLDATTMLSRPPGVRRG